MQRISDERFIENKPKYDTVIAIRVDHGNFYFLGWMEDAPNYKIQQPFNVEDCLLDRDMLMVNENLYDAITETPGYNHANLLWLTDEDGQLLQDEDKEYANEYERFLSIVRPYERNGECCSDDHDIICLNNHELGQFCDILRDGDYVFVLTDEYITGLKSNEDIVGALKHLRDACKDNFPKIGFEWDYKALDIVINNMERGDERCE